MLEILSNKILEELASFAVGMLGERVKKINEKSVLDAKEGIATTARLHTSSTLIRNHLQTHIQEIKRWSSHTSFFDQSRQKSVGDIYVDLETYLIPISAQISLEERNNRANALPALQATSSHCVLLGQPGACKTTLVQKICLDFF